MLSLSPLGLSEVVNTHVDGLQETFSQSRASALAVAPNGDTILVWASDDQDGSSSGVYAQRLDAAGLRVGEEFQINTTTYDSQTFPSVAVDDDGDFVVTWSSLFQDGGGYGVYARCYDSTGTALGGEFRVNQHTPGNQNFSSVAMDADGDFVITWASSEQDGDKTGVYARCFNAGGTATSNEFLVNTTTQGNQRQADVSMDAGGGFFVVWNSQDQDGGGGGIFGRRYQFDATPLGDEIAVNTTTAGNQQFPAIDMDASGAVVVWQSFDAGVDAWRVYAQRFDAQGNADGDELLAATGRTASVTKGLGNDFIVAWETDSTEDSEILARHFGSVGQPWGATVSLSGSNRGSQSAASIARTDSRLIVVHTEVMDDGTGDDTDIVLTYGNIVPDDNLNMPPQIDAIDNQTVDECALMQLTISASDPDSDPSNLTFSLAGSPPAGIAIDPATGLLSWTPTETQGPGVYGVSVRVTDAGTPPLSDVTSFWITVDEANLPPQVETIEPQTTDQGENVSVTVTAVDEDLPANTLAFGLGEDAPDGATIDPSSGLFSWTPGMDVIPGDHEITVVVSDDGAPSLEGSGTLAVRVEPALLESIPDQTITEGQTLVVTLEPSGAEEFAHSVTLSLDATTVEGVAFDPVTGEFSWTPYELQGSASYQFTVRASDPNYTLDDIETFTVDVAEGNQPPILDPIEDLQCRQGHAVSTTVTAVDDDLPANTLTFSLGTDAPDGADIDPSSGFFSWTTDADVTVGLHEITVFVTDNGDPKLSDSATLTVSVEPALLKAIADQTVVEGEPLIVTVLPAEGEEFPDNVILSLDETPVEGVAFDTASGEFSWTPNEEQGPGTYEFTVRASEDGSDIVDDTVTFAVEVTEDNLAPVLDPLGDLQCRQGRTVSTTVTAVDDDLPANTLMFSLGTDAPDGAAIDPSRGIFSWTPGVADTLGEHDITIIVTDDGDPEMSDSGMLTISVEPALLASIADQTVVEGETLVFTVLPAEGEEFPDNVTISLDETPVEGVAFDPASGEYSWTPAEDQGPGTYEFTVRASEDDSDFVDDTVTFAVNVIENNLAPVLDPIEDLECNRGHTVSTTITCVDDDLPANTLTFSLGVDAPDGAAIDPSSGIFSWTPGADVTLGIHEITVVVADDGDPELSDSGTLTIHVKPAFLELVADQTVVECETLIVTIVPVDGDEFPEGITLSLDATSVEGVSFNPQTHEFSWTPTEEQGPGAYQFTIRASDAGNPAVDDAVTFTVVVIEENLAPILGPLEQQTTDQGETVELTVTAVDDDLPSNNLTFGLGVDAPDGATIDETSGLFSWTPDTNVIPGDYVITITVSDDGSPSLDDSETLAVRVEPALLESIPDQTVVEGQTLVITLEPSGAEEFAAGVTLSLDATTVEGVAFDPATGVFSWTPTEAQGPGEYQFTVRASDTASYALDDIETFTVIVTEESHSPVLDPIGDMYCRRGYLFTTTITGFDSDVPADDLIFSLDAGDAFGAVIDPDTGELTWDIPWWQPKGRYDLTVTLSDNSATLEETTATFALIVNELGDELVMFPLINLIVPEGLPVMFGAALRNRGPAVGVVSYELGPGAPDGATISPVGQFSWTPGQGAGGELYEITVIARDQAATPLETSETFVVFVQMQPQSASSSAAVAAAMPAPASAGLLHDKALEELTMQKSKPVPRDYCLTAFWVDLLANSGSDVQVVEDPEAILSLTMELMKTTQ